MKPATAQQWETLAAAAARAGDFPTAEEYASRADALTPSAVAWANLHRDAALWYVACGQPVFPLEAYGKKPLPGSHGWKDATLDSEQVMAWWGENPDYNIGLPTGKGLDVVDIDAPEGETWWAGLAGRPEVLGVTATPRGRHYWVRSTGSKNRAGMGPHVDYRGAGGYVVAPPSYLHPSKGHPGGIYRWAFCPFPDSTVNTVHGTASTVNEDHGGAS